VPRDAPVVVQFQFQKKHKRHGVAAGESADVFRTVTLEPIRCNPASP
jgi:hypothetical protein